MTEFKNVEVKIDDRVGVLTIDHPPANAFNRETVLDLGVALDELLANDQVKVIVITGAGQFAFVAGADINEIAALETPDQVRDFLLRGQSVCNRIESAAKPVIAAVNALALGGGLELAMSCHIRIFSDRARVGQTEINLGLIPGWGGSQRLPRLIGPGKALELILTGDMIDAQEAHRLGLANRVVPADHLLAEAMRLAKKIASKSALTHRAALSAVVGGVEMSLVDGLHHEMTQFVSLVGSHDFREGPAAFLEKRQPNFTDD